MMRAGWTRWLRATPLTGRLALLCAVVAVAVPTLIRVGVSGSVSGCEFTPYLPFVLISAILLRWWQAAAVALACVVVLGGFLDRSMVHEMDCFLPAASMFLGSSAVMIGIAVGVKRWIAAVHNRGADESAGGIVFSLEKGKVWASWYGQGAPVCLGSQGKVSEMMEDFLAQVEVGRRLNAQ
jgi:hypothetical protein